MTSAERKHPSSHLPVKLLYPVCWIVLQLSLAHAFHFEVCAVDETADTTTGKIEGWIIGKVHIADKDFGRRKNTVGPQMYVADHNFGIDLLL
jgi:hypothetical protein